MLLLALACSENGSGTNNPDSSVVDSGDTGPDDTATEDTATEDTATEDTAAELGFDFDGTWHPASQDFPCEQTLIAVYADDSETAAAAYFGTRLTPGEFTVSAFNLEAPAFEPGTVAMLFQYIEQEPMWGSGGTSGTLTVSDAGNGGTDVKWSDVDLRTLAGDTGMSREGWLRCH